MSKKWYEQDETKIRGKWLKDKYSNIFIGSDPRDGATPQWGAQFDAIINVSCTEGATFDPVVTEQRTYWFPLNEMGEWPLAYFHLMFKALDHHYNKGHKIYVHCHAGAYRSPSIVRWWLMTKGESFENSLVIAKGRPLSEKPDQLKFELYHNYIMGNLPPGFQTFIHRYEPRNREFTQILLNPTIISHSNDVESTYMKSIRYNKLRNIKSFIRNTKNDIKEWFHNRKHKLIRIHNGMWTTTTKDWEKAAKEFRR